MSRAEISKLFPNELLKNQATVCPLFHNVVVFQLVNKCSGCEDLKLRRLLGFL